jgi:hypothetical protein
MENIMRIFQITVSAIILSIASSSVSADYTVDKGNTRTQTPQDIVLTLGVDPVMNPEVACLALTMGQFLRSSSKKVNVTLFLRNDGVKLASEAELMSAGVPCITPWGPRTLRENLIEFIAGNPNNMVNCPICWGARFGEMAPDYGVLESTAIPPLFLGADKVIDF